MNATEAAKAATAHYTVHVPCISLATGSYRDFKVEVAGAPSETWTGTEYQDIVKAAQAHVIATRKFVLAADIRPTVRTQ